MLNVAILALDNSIHSTVTGPFDIFTIADIQAKEINPDGKGFCRVEIVAPVGGSVTAFNGLTIPTTASINDYMHYDVIITPALLGDYQAVINDEFIITWLSRQHERGACICSICAGAFLVARAGLFDGKKPQPTGD